MDLEAKLNTEFRAWLRAVILLTGLVTCLGAAARDTGTVRGQVADSVTGRALAGAIVRISSTDVAAVTGPEGRFLLQGVPAGSVSLEVSFLGYGTFIDTIEVIAGGSVLRNVRLGDATETMLVVGQASGQARALNEQRTARNLVNVVSSDFIGNFPDQNVAEALGRLPGVTIQRNRGEGRYASIRGLDAQLVSYSLDGMSMAAPRPDERAVLLDIIPTDVVDQLEVSKTLLPDQPADAIGGAINVVSSSPFDSGGQISRVKLQSNYSNLSNDWMPHVAGTLGGTFGEARTLGAIITLSYDERTLAADALWTDPWERAVDPLTGQESYLASRLDVQRYDLTRTRSGATANLEYRPSDDSRYMLRANYNLFTDDAVRHRSRIQMDEDGLVSLDDDSAVVNVGDIPDLGGTEIVQTDSSS